MQRLARVALIVAAAAAFSLAAAADTEYNTQAAFAAATSNPTTLNLVPYDYNFLADYSSAFTVAAGNPVTIAAAPGNFEGTDVYVISQNYSYCCQVGVDSLFSYPGVTLTFADPIEAISWIGGNGADTPLNDIGYPYGGNIVTAIVGGNTYTFSGGTGLTPAFGGVVTSAPFTTITFESTGNVFFGYASYIELGDITYADVTTPEPSSLLLLGTGFAGFLGMLRRRPAK